MKKYIILLFALFCNQVFSQYFHDTQGKLDISSSGQATFVLPIAMPPSIKDVGPVINLVYSSGQINGIAGQGWNISSISNISRVATRQDIDGYKDGVDFDNNDKLALDGQRLLLKTGTYLGNGSVYETEVQSNTKIEMFVEGTMITFIVTNTDGSRSWYGGTDASDLNAFYITRFEDTFGNFITYHYNLISPNNIPSYTIQVPVYRGHEIIRYDTVTIAGVNSFNSVTIAEIRFSANTQTNIQPLNKIKFTYKLANSFEEGYLKGNLIKKLDLLSKIEVFTNDNLFKRYELTHTIEQKLQKLQEFNTAGEAANPILFEYNPKQIGATETINSYTDSFDPTNQPIISGDFDGDGYSDMVTPNKVYTRLFNGAFAQGVNLSFTANKRTTFAATTLNYNGPASLAATTKLNQKQSIVNTNESINSVTFNVYNTIYNELYPNAFSLNYSKTIQMDNAGHCYDNCLSSPGNPIATYRCPTVNYVNQKNEFLEGDFNGDGISEVLIVTKSDYTLYNISPWYPGNQNPYECIQSQSGDSVSGFRIVDLNPHTPITANTKGNYVLSTEETILLAGNGGAKRYLIDFNSDGKTDVLTINSNGSYKVITFSQLLISPWIELEIIGQGTIDEYSTTKQMLIGDYNGDGKPDIMLPDNENGGNSWHIYYNNPKITVGEMFEKDTIETPFEYLPSAGDDSDFSAKLYYALDTNKDGKTDIVQARLRRYQPGGPSGWGGNRDTEWQIENYKNIGGDFQFDYISPSTHDNDSNVMPIVLPSNYKKNGKDSDILVIRYHPDNNFWNSITFVSFNEDKGKECLLTKVTQSSGAIVDDISYSPMIDNDENAISNIYTCEENSFYPNFEIKKIKQNYLVSQLKNTSLGISKFQDFKYRGYVVNLRGIGSIGFTKTARSRWYRTSADRKLWNVQENSPLMRGANLKAYSVLLNSDQAFNFSNTYDTQIIDQTENEFEQTTEPISKRYKLLLKKKFAKNKLTNVNRETIYEYDSEFLLPTKVISNNYLGTTLQGTSKKETLYDNAIIGTGNNYYIGRPKETTTTTTAYGNTQIFNEKYTYTDGNISRSEKKANNDVVSIVDEFEYFPNGLLKNKTTSATGTDAENEVSPKTTSVTYDPTNRFVKTSTDIEGLVTTNLNYDSIYGTVLSQQNPFGHTTTSIIDNWGKQTRVTDFLGKSINYYYVRSADSSFTTTQIGDDGSSSISMSDALARNIQKGVKNINNEWSYTQIEYDYLGRKIRESEPYLASQSPSQWAIYTYDQYDRLINLNQHTGKQTNSVYNGLTVTASDGVLAKSKTMNANGHQVSATDTPGGIILFKYDALGNLIESNYEGIKNIISYDNWGRKTSLFDTSAGNYTYKYDAYGSTIFESTPKGKTTIKYDAVGKVLQKNIIGNTDEDHTNILSEYEYDNSTKLLKHIKVTNPFDGDSYYDYKYDNLLRMVVTSERLKNATFVTEIDYDSFGRIDSETKTAIAFDKQSKTKTINTYKNGFHWQILNEFQNVLWELKTTNARGQVTGTTLGNGINTTNTYDLYGYSSKIKHLKNNSNIMTLDTNFEPILGNLIKRSNSMFDKTEHFHYDSLDRLDSWTGGVPEILSDITFPTSTEGFTYYGDPQGGISNYNQQLKVRAVGFESGVSKILATNVPIGKSLEIQFDMIYVSGLSGLYVEIYESNPSTGQTYNFVELGEINQITNQTQYLVQHNNVDVVIRFYINTGYERTINQNSAQIGPPTGVFDLVFYIDNILVSSQHQNNQSYDDRGRITENSLGVYNYEEAEKAYQNTSIVIPQTGIDYYKLRPFQNISYNAFKSPVVIEEQDGETISFEYNFMQNRSAMYFGGTSRDKDNSKFTKIYSADGSMEIKYDTDSNESTFITYIGGDAYSAALLTKNTGKERISKNSYFYLHRDYQNTILAITNSEGSVVEKRLFDAWGSVLEVQDGNNNILSGLTFFDRGYTGHEHLQGVGLINMNARLYDPKLHRFLQPDALIQDPYNTQNYNRYSYCVNNPLKYTDISGNDFGMSLLIALAVAVFTNVATNYIAGTPITFGDILQTAVMTTISAAVTFGIGSAVETIGNFFIKATVQSLAHGVFQGGLTAIQGGNFWNGFAAGSISSMASSLWAGGTNTTEGPDNSRISTKGTGFTGIGGTSGTSMIVFGTIAGGAGAALTGGNFWQGAATGLIVSALNHNVHQMDLIKEQTKLIAKAYGESLGDVYRFLKEHPITLTLNEDGSESLGFKGVSFVSSKVQNSANINYEGVIGFVTDRVVSKLMGNLIKGAGSLLANGNMAKDQYDIKQEQQYKNNLRNSSIEFAKGALISKMFSTSIQWDSAIPYRPTLLTTVFQKYFKP